jgi:hypothetical protein
MRPKLTYANVVATLALFIAIGGASAFAASQLGKNSVGTKQLKNGSVTTKKLKSGAITGAKVRDGSLTGADVVASTLGTVPRASNADSLRGIGPDGFVQGGGHSVSTGGAVTIQASTTGTVLDISGFGTISLVCSPAGNGSFSFTNHSGAPMYASAEALFGGGAATNLLDGSTMSPLTSSNAGNIVTFQGATSSGPPKLLTFTASNSIQSGNCVAAALAQTNP